MVLFLSNIHRTVKQQFICDYFYYRLSAIANLAKTTKKIKKYKINQAENKHGKPNH